MSKAESQKAKKAHSFARALTRQQERADRQLADQQEAARREAEAKDVHAALRLRQQAQQAPVPPALVEAIPLEIKRAQSGQSMAKTLRPSSGPFLPVIKPVKPDSVQELAAQAVVNVQAKMRERAAQRGKPLTEKLSPDIVRIEATRLWRDTHYTALLKKAGIYKTVEARRIHQQVARDKPEGNALHEQAGLELALYSKGGRTLQSGGAAKTGLAGNVAKAFDALLLENGDAPIKRSELETRALGLWRADRLKQQLAAARLSKVEVPEMSPRKVEDEAPVKVKPPREKKKKKLQEAAAPERIEMQRRRNDGIPTTTTLRRYAIAELERVAELKANPENVRAAPTSRIALVVTQAVTALTAETDAYNATRKEGSVERKVGTSMVVDRTAAMLRAERSLTLKPAPHVPAVKAAKPLAVKVVTATPVRQPSVRALKRIEREREEAAQFEAIKRETPSTASVFNMLGRTLQSQAAGLPQLLTSLRNEPDGHVPPVVVKKSLELAGYLSRHNAPQRALGLLGTLSQKQPEDGEVMLQLAFARVATGNIPAALRTFSAAMALPDMKVPALAGMAETYLHANRPHQVVKLFETYPDEADNPKLKALQDAAKADLEAKAVSSTLPRPRVRRSQRPLPVLEEAVVPPLATSTQGQGRRRPVYSFNQISQQNALEGDIARLVSLGVGQQAIATMPDADIAQRPDVLQSCGDVHMAEGDTRRALKAYHRAIALKPDDVALRLSAAEAAQGEGEFEASTTHLHHALTLHPRMTKARALLATGEILQAHQQGDAVKLEAGKQTLAKIQTSAPHRSDVLALRSRALFTVGDYTGAIALEQTAHPNMPLIMRTAKGQHELEQCATVYANAGLARMLMVEQQPVEQQRPMHEAAYNAFAHAKDVVSAPLKQRTLSHVKGFNIYSQNMLIKLTTLQMEAANRGGANKSQKAIVQDALDSLKGERDKNLERAQRILPTVAKKGPEQAVGERRSFC